MVAVVLDCLVVVTVEHKSGEEVFLDMSGALLSRPKKRMVPASFFETFEFDPGIGILHHDGGVSVLE